MIMDKSGMGNADLNKNLSQWTAILQHFTTIELVFGGISYMVAYEFYWMNSEEKEHLIGILPERRKNAERME